MRFSFLEVVMNIEIYTDGSCETQRRIGERKIASEITGDCSTRLSTCVPGGIRTPGLLFRRQSL